MSLDPYTTGMISTRPDFPHTEIRSSVVAVLKAVRDERGLVLIPQRTRCFRSQDIHEILLTDELGAGPGVTVNRVASIAFVGFEQGGVVAEGDVLTKDSLVIGEVVGFDETHAPNHINIVVRNSNRASGIELGIQLREKLIFGSEQRSDHA